MADIGTDAPFSTASRVKQAREKAGLTRAQLAEHLNMSADNLKKIEGGSRGLQADLLLAINEHVGNLDFNFFFNPEMTYEEASLKASFADRVASAVSEKMNTQATSDPEANTLAQRIANSPQLRTVVRDLMPLPEDELRTVHAMVFAWQFRNSDDQQKGEENAS